jgi:hypothetical protein
LLNLTLLTLEELECEGELSNPDYVLSFDDLLSLDIKFINMDFVFRLTYGIGLIGLYGD